MSDAALGPSGLRIDNGRFIDSYGRTINLRGVNVAGSSKLPTSPNGLSHLHEGFYEPTAPYPSSVDHSPSQKHPALRPASRVGIAARTAARDVGIDLHKGPSKDDLDWEYIDYLEKLLQYMAEYGLKCFVCAHQDVWSRFSGGSGAPGWTFEVAGLDIEAFTETGQRTYTA